MWSLLGKKDTWHHHERGFGGPDLGPGPGWGLMRDTAVSPEEVAFHLRPDRWAAGN